LIKNRDENGRPKDLHFIADDKTITLEGGEEFVIGYFPEDVISKKD